ncbi:hypothetical protein [Paenarthrobacter sp. NPDC090522]|uniref:hypothetical protein n=1 Tax=Paenarthrobacter sp. NPDC090522 TaxID=3364383 RepID=UPI003809A9FE
MAWESNMAVPSPIEYVLEFPKPVKSVEFVVDLSTSVSEKSLVALVKPPATANVIPGSWTFSGALQGHFKYLAAEEPNAYSLPKLSFDDFVSEVRLHVVPWGQKLVTPERAVTGIWAVSDFVTDISEDLNVIVKGRLV